MQHGLQGWPPGSRLVRWISESFVSGEVGVSTSFLHLWVLMEPKYMGRCAVWVGLAPLSCDGGSVETFTAGAHVGSHFHETVECGGFNRRGFGA